MISWGGTWIGLEELDKKSPRPEVGWLLFPKGQRSLAVVPSAADVLKWVCL